MATYRKATVLKSKRQVVVLLDSVVHNNEAYSIVENSSGEVEVHKAKSLLISKELEVVPTCGACLDRTVALGDTVFCHFGKEYSVISKTHATNGECVYLCQPDVYGALRAIRLSGFSK